MTKKLTHWATAVLLASTALGLTVSPSSATASMTSTMTIEIKCDDSTHLYWREYGSSSWTQLTTNLSGAPSIIAPTEATTTFRFVEYSGSNEEVVFKPSAGGQPQLLPASFQLDAGERQDVYAAKNTSSPGWYGGYVKIPIG